MDDMKNFQKVLTRYSTQKGIEEYTICGQDFSAFHTFASDGLLPLFVRKAKEITDQGSLHPLYVSSGFSIDKDPKALSGEVVCIDPCNSNKALALFLIVEVIHERLEISETITKQNSSFLSDDRKIRLDGMLGTYNLEELNQGRSSGNANTFLRAATSPNAVGI